jgi:hypothetical protein
MIHFYSRKYKSYLPGKAGLGCTAIGGSGSITDSCAGLCTVSMGECIKKAKKTYRRGSANLVSGKQSISQTTITNLTLEA